MTTPALIVNRKQCPWEGGYIGDHTPTVLGFRPWRVRWWMGLGRGAASCL